MKAKDYYYKHYLPWMNPDISVNEYQYLAAQKIIDKHYSEAACRNEYSKISDYFELKFSNEYFVDCCCLNLTKANSEIKRFLSNSFVAVNASSANINAAAYHQNDDYEGELVDLDAGLLNYFRHFASAFAAFSNVLDDENTKSQRNASYVSFKEIMCYLDLVKKSGNVRSSVNSVEMPKIVDERVNHDSVVHFFSALYFVISHEFGHHICKHTDTRNALFIEYLSELDIGIDNDSHKHEYEADFFALNSLDSLINYYSEQATKEGSEGSMLFNTQSISKGALLAMLALAHWSGSPDAVSATHPSIYNRSLVLLRHYCRLYKTNKDYTHGLYLLIEFSRYVFPEEKWVDNFWSSECLYDFYSIK